MRTVQPGWPAGELSLPEIGLGGNIFGRFCEEHETRGILLAALDAGINFVDTSDSYSDGLSETYIGNTIHLHRRHWIIGTKAGIKSDESPRGLGRRERIRLKLEQSLRRLRTDWVDLYQMHHFDAETPLEETLYALNELRHEGKIRCIGVSNYNVAQLSRAVDVVRRSGTAPIATLQNHFNMFKREGETDWLPFCEENGICVLAYGVLARGILSGKYKSGSPIPEGSRASVSNSVRTDLTAEVLSTVDALSEFAHALGVKVSQLAVSWTLSRPGITSLVLGTRSVAQLKDHVRALDISLRAVDLSRIASILGPATRFADLRLGSLRPT